MVKRILILCTGNSCRSQMAEGFLKSFDSAIEVYSAGTDPAKAVHLKAIQVLKEVGVDISRNYPKNIDEFMDKDFDYVITVCGDAMEACPAFTGKVKHRIHIGFDDPAKADGTEDEILAVFRSIRDEIKEKFFEFYNMTQQ
ncbi:MAG: arsenate reductase ArsC [Proteobacteria bacterium]|nr:arsenate reductase ArsC [Pseudomonadota bacterium]